MKIGFKTNRISVERVPRRLFPKCHRDRAHAQTNFHRAILISIIALYPLIYT